MLAEVVVPGWVLRPPPQRRDDRYPIAVVEVERAIPTRLPCPCASRLEQRRGNRCRGAEPTPRELQQIRVDLPGDVDGKLGPCPWSRRTGTARDTGDLVAYTDPH